MVKLKIAGDELTMEFDNGQTIRLARARQPVAGAGDKVDKDNLEGIWKLTEVKWAEEGRTSTIILSSKSYLIIDGGQMTERDEQDGEKVSEAKYKFSLDTSKKPAVYERKELGGRDKGKATTGVYSLDGDTLLLCLMKEGLPTDFAITQGKDVKDKYLYTYKRQKP